MRPSRREFVKWVTASGIALSLSRLGRRRKPAFLGARVAARAAGWNPAANGAGRIDGVAKVTGAKLYASDFRAADLPGWPAKTSHAILVRAPDATHVYTGMDLARLSGTMKPSVVVTAEDLARIGARVPEFYAGDLFCPVGKTPLYHGSAGGAADLRDVRCLRPGAAGAARRDLRQIRRRDRPRRRAQLWRLPLYPRGGGHARCARYLFADPGGLGHPRALPRHGASGLVAAREGNAGALRQGRDLWRADPRRARGEKSGAAGARSRLRDPIRRPDVSRAGMRSRLVQRKGDSSSSCSACSRPTRPRSRSRSCSARPAPRSSLRASTPSSPMSAAVLADATTPRSCSMSRWRRCSFPAGRCGWRMTAISNSRAASNATPSRCARGSGSIARPARSRPSPRTMCWTAAALRIFRPMWRLSVPSPRSASMTFRKSTLPRSRSTPAA